VSIRAERLRKGCHSTNLDIQKCCESGFYLVYERKKKEKKKEKIEMKKGSQMATDRI